MAVFKLPEKPEVRYIKRLVGMPDEVLRTQEGRRLGQAGGRFGGLRAGSGRWSISRPCR